MVNMLINSIIAAGVTALMQVIVYNLFTRRWKEQEKLFDGLQVRLAKQEADLREISEKRLEKFEQGLVIAAQKRKEIYEYMRDNLVTCGHCRTQHEHYDGGIARIEKALDGMRAQVAENNAITNNLQGVLNLIKGQLKISLQ